MLLTLTDVCMCVYAEAGSSLISAGRLRCSGGTAASSATSIHCHSAPVQHICCTLLLQKQNEQNKPYPVPHVQDKVPYVPYEQSCSENLYGMVWLIRTDPLTPTGTNCETLTLY